MADHIYRRFRAEDEPALARLEGTAFAVPVEEAPRWFDLAGRDQLWRLADREAETLRA